MGNSGIEDLSCWEVDKEGLIVRMLDGELTSDVEDVLLFHLKHCTACLAIVADVLFARSQFEQKGKDYTIHVN